MKYRTVFLSVFISVCTTLCWGQTYDLSATMKAVLSDGVLTVSTTANTEAMPDWSDYPRPPWIGKSGEIHSIVIENKVTSTGMFTFAWWHAPTTVTMSNSVTTISNATFFVSDGITSVTLPNVTTIGDVAFWGCTGLTSVTMPNVTSIGNSVFFNCSGLTSVTMPNVTTIGLDAFRGCSSLKNITIPNSVTTLKSGAFWGCTGLKNVSVAWETPLSDDEIFYVFYDVNISDITLNVPPGTKALYEVADVWKDFGTIQETGVIPEVTQPVSENGNGAFSLCLYVPSDATLTGSFEIQFPDGFTLDEQLTVLSVEFGGSGATLSFTAKGNNTWLIEIKPSDLKSANVTEYRKIMDIAYKANVSVTIGSYEVKIMNLEFTTNDGTSIKEELLSFNIPVNQQPTSIETVRNTPFKAYFTSNMLSIESPYAETIAVYSVMGTQLYSTVKKPGIINIPLLSQRGTIVIIQGNKSGTVKILKQR